MKAKFRKKYSAQGLASGSAFCPACRKLVTLETQICPACGFSGHDTLAIFSSEAPPLERMADHARLFSGREMGRIARRVRSMGRRYPQIRWKFLTARLPEEIDPGLFAFWLLNVSPLAEGETAEERTWTVLLVFLEDGAVAVAPGYAVEPWFSGEDWGVLLENLHAGIGRAGHGPALAAFFRQADRMLTHSWVRMWSKLGRPRNRWNPQKA